MPLSETSAMKIQESLSIGDLGGYLERVAEIAPALIYVYNQVEQRNEYSNRGIGEALGYSAQDVKELGASLMIRLLHPDDHNRVFAHFQKITALGDDEVADVEYRMRHKDGRWVWLLSRDTVFQRDASGAVTHHIGSAVDISAQKEAQKRAIMAEEAATAINDELRDFAYSMSHDMKAPTNTLQLIFSELDEPENLNKDSTKRELLDMARSTVSRMRTLIEDVLDYTQVIGHEIEFETVCLDTLMEGLIQTLRADIKDSQATVDVDPLPDVKGSRMQLIILFQNLIQNALKFRNPETPLKIEIRHDLNPMEGCVDIHVVDNGTGIPKEKHEKIFQLFHRDHANAGHDGTGIGLAVCRRIANNHGCSIKVDSFPGKGAAFSMRLKLA